MNPHISHIVNPDAHKLVVSSVSYLATVARFSNPAIAFNYPKQFGCRHRERREELAVRRALESIPIGGHVLDLPCGTGRLLPLLTARYTVTAADVSPSMLTLAMQNEAESRAENAHSCPAVTFELRDVIDTGYASDSFDGVICHRLFHHFSDANLRRAALRELRRISRGPIVVSFFNRFALDTILWALKDRLRRRRRIDRIPIPMNAMRADVEAAGLRIRARYAKRWGISPLWVLVLEKA